MSNLAILLLVAVIVALFFIAVCIAVPWLVRKGINLTGIIAGTGSALDTAGVVIDGIQEFIPENKGLCIIERIIDYAKEAVRAAEQIYLASGMETDGRKKEAYNQVTTALGYAGIELTPEIETIINTAIEAAVFALPKTHTTE